MIGVSIMKIGFVGAGKVGSALGRDFYQKGIAVSGYFSLDFSHSQAAASLTASQAFSSIAELIHASDIVFLTVNDDAIQTVVKMLMKEPKTCFEKKIIAHTSGVHASNVLQPLDELGAALYAVHPLQAFASVEQALSLLGGTVFSVEGTGLSSIDGEPTALNAAGEGMLNFMAKTSYDFFVIKAEDKARYHAAAVISSNYLVATLDFALSQFEKIGCSKAFAMKALSPLIQGTIDNIDRYGTVEALTGPIARGDVNTIKKHLACLDSEEVSLYRALGRKTLALALAKGLPETTEDQLLNLLKEDYNGKKDS